MERLGITLDAYDRPRTPNLPHEARSLVFTGHCRAGTLTGMNMSQQLSQEAVNEFKSIYQDEFGRELSDDEVQEIAMRLLRFFGILAMSGAPTRNVALSIRGRVDVLFGSPRLN